MPLVLVIYEKKGNNGTQQFKIPNLPEIIQTIREIRIQLVIYSAYKQAAVLEVTKIKETRRTVDILLMHSRSKQL